jgi:hypothetical protein
VLLYCTRSGIVGSKHENECFEIVASFRLIGVNVLANEFNCSAEVINRVHRVLHAEFASGSGHELNEALCAGMASYARIKSALSENHRHDKASVYFVVNAKRDNAFSNTSCFGICELFVMLLRELGVKWNGIFRADYPIAFLIGREVVEPFNRVPLEVMVPVKVDLLCEATVLELVFAFGSGFLANLASHATISA